MNTILTFVFKKKQNKTKQKQKKQKNYVFLKYIIKSTQKDPILHVTTTFSPKQGGTRTSST